MLNQIYIKVYYLLFFIFLFVFSLKQYFQVEFLYVIISLFWIFIIPFKGVISSYFKKLYISPCVNNLFLNKWFILLSFFIVFWSMISYSPLFLLIILSYLFLISFKIDENKLFLAWISLFIVFLFLYFIGLDTYSIYLIYSFYLFISGIIYYSINTFVNIDNFFKKNGDTVIKYSLTISFIIFITCLYFIKIFFLLPYLVLINLITLNLLWNYKIDIKSTNDFFKNDFSILWLFIIIFVPLINDFFQVQEKTNILFLAFLWFFLIYIWLNLKIDKSDINKFLNLKVTRKDAKSSNWFFWFNKNDINETTVKWLDLNTKTFIKKIPIIKTESYAKIILKHKRYFNIYKISIILILISFVYVKYIISFQTADNQIKNPIITTKSGEQINNNNNNTISDNNTININSVWSTGSTDLSIENSYTNQTDVNKDSQVDLNTDSQNLVKKVKIWDIYKFNNYLSYGNESEDTKKLQEFLTKLWYFKWEINGKFWNDTMFALKDALIHECNWPKTNKGVLGSKAAACIEILEIDVND